MKTLVPLLVAVCVVAALYWLYMSHFSAMVFQLHW